MALKGEQEVGRKRDRNRERRVRDLEWRKKKKGERKIYPYIFYHNYTANQTLKEAKDTVNLIYNCTLFLSFVEL